MKEGMAATEPINNRSGRVDHIQSIAPLSQRNSFEFQRDLLSCFGRSCGCDPSQRLTIYMMRAATNYLCCGLLIMPSAILSFNPISAFPKIVSCGSNRHEVILHESMKQAGIPDTQETTVWEEMGKLFHPGDISSDIEEVRAYSQTVTLLRVGIPSLFLATSLNIAYPTTAIVLANWINDSGVFAVVAQDASQYIQNILTTSGLMFSILVGQTYYFMYQQQEAIYLALFEEVAMAKSLLEQVSLVSQGRQSLYEKILGCVQDYVQSDLTKFNDIEPSVLISSRPVDDPLEEILYLTSVGEPSLVYQTVRSLRQARAARLGALQRKLPPLHMFLLWTLFGIVLFTFPLLGAGVQTIGGMGILEVQAWYLGFIVFGMSLTIGVINELRQPNMTGAYNARFSLNLMVAGLEEELDLRLRGVIKGPPEAFEPSVDSDGFADPTTRDATRR